MQQSSKLGMLLAAGGAIGGALWSMNKGKSTGTIVLYAALLGVGGLLVGNSITKFYE